MNTAFLCLILVGICRGQNPVLTILPVKLPYPSVDAKAVYDGNDLIYIVGGVGGGVNGLASILKFSISEETITEVGRMEPLRFHSCFWDGSSVVILGGFGNVSHSEYISRYIPGDWNPKPAGILPWGTRDSCVIQFPGKDEVLLMGGDTFGEKIVKYSLNTATEAEGRLPIERSGSSCILYSGGGEGIVYMFGGYSDGMLNHIVQYDVETKKTSFLPTKLPTVFDSGTAVFNGTYAYLIGGFASSAKDVVRFDPVTMALETLTVGNFPNRLFNFASTFVPGLNRVYIFGGQPSYNEMWDDVMFLSL